MSTRTGHCLCGAVSFGIEGPLADVLHCHCENCRRTTGNFIAASRVEFDDIVFIEASGLRWYDVEDYASYGFCCECGATIFFRAVDAPDRVSVCIGMLDSAEDLELGSVWFAGEAQPHNQLPGGVPHHTANG
ncbi:MAG: GFA family protein [Actinomycetota bacterium]